MTRFYNDGAYLTGLYTGTLYKVIGSYDYAGEVICQLETLDGHYAQAKQRNLRASKYEEKLEWASSTKRSFEPETNGKYLVISAHTKTHAKRTYLHQIADAVDYALSLFKTNPAKIDTYYVVEIKKVVHGPQRVVTETPASVHDWNSAC